MTVHVEDLQPLAATARRPRNRRRIAIMVVAVVLVCAVVAAIVAARQWPFTRSAVSEALQQQSGGTVEIGSFRQVYFPSPGCVAERLTFRRNSDNQATPFLTIQRLTIVGSYHGLLTHHISTIRAEGLHVTVEAPEESRGNGPSEVNIGSLPTGMTIGKIIADDAQVEFAPTQQRAQRLIFRIPKLGLHDLAGNQPLAFKARVQIPEPPVDLEVSGKFGPWHTGSGGQSTLSGSYVVNSLDLGAFPGIGGILTSKGNFDGLLQHVTMHGSVDTPKFTVSTSGHPIHVMAEYAATVNGLNGDVDVDAARLRFGRTTLLAAGSVAGHEGKKGKTASFEFSSNHARVQDLLWIFISDKQPPMTGPILFRAHATLPPDDRPFLNRVRLVGDFGISDAQYPNPDTQKNIDVLSARARGKADEVEDTNDKLGNDSYDPGRVLSNTKGHVVLNDAVAHLSNVSFDVPGAEAKVNGTYQLRTEQIDLQGHMHLESELSKTTTGVKSFLLKVVQPFMKKGKHNESVIAIKIGGTYKNPTYAVVPRAEK